MALAQSHALELHDGNAVTYVACKRALGRETVGVEDAENLAGAKRHNGVPSGIFVTTGSFADQCLEAAEAAGIELIDREALHRQLDSVDLCDVGSHPPRGHALARSAASAAGRGRLRKKGGPA